MANNASIRMLDKADVHIAGNAACSRRKLYATWTWHIPSRIGKNFLWNSNCASGAQTFLVKLAEYNL
jgi:hypothetical protein